MNVMNPKAAARTTAYENELVQVRKFVLIAEEILHEGGPRPARTRTRATQRGARSGHPRKARSGLCFFKRSALRVAS